MARGKKTGGRTSGTPNRITVELKTAIEGAFAKLGGEDYLVKVGKEQPQVFCTLLGRVLPKQLEHSLPEPPEKKMDVLEIARRITFVLAEAKREQAKREAANAPVGLSPMSSATA